MANDKAAVSLASCFRSMKQLIRLNIVGKDEFDKAHGAAMPPKVPVEDRMTAAKGKDEALHGASNLTGITIR